MALLNKLFFPTASEILAPIKAVVEPTTVNTSSTSSTRTSSSTSTSTSHTRYSNNQSVHSKNYLSQFPFDGSQVRVLLYRESDNQGRRLLFDSNALQKISLKESNGNSTKAEKIRRSFDRVSTSATNINYNKDLLTSSAFSKKQQYQQQQSQKHNNKGPSNGFIEVNEEFGYKHNRPKSADITSVGEMVFGALAMSFRGTALKVHWLQAPSRILCSQVFLSPINCANGQSSHSIISMNSLTTPRHSISSEYGSVDGLSMNSFSMPFSVSVGRHVSLTPSEHSSVTTSPLDVPDPQSVSINSVDSMRMSSDPRFSATYSTGTDSGYSGTSRSGGVATSSDRWSSSYQYSTRSSLGSVMSDQSESLRKMSIDSSCFPTSSPYSEEFSSDCNLQRRISQNIRTSFENETSMSDFIGFMSDYYAAGPGGSEGSVAMGGIRASYCANESRSDPEIGRARDTPATKASNRRAKLGLTVCIYMSESFEEEMEVFCSEHIALLESMLSRLRAYTERAYINHRDFLQIMFHGWQETQQWVNDLFTAPRIKCPVWLSITTSGSKYSKNVAERFIKELCWLLSLADTKDTNFFISTMLTAILTHHLGWVSTVSAFSHASASSLMRSETAAASIEQRAKLLEVSQKHPYNALWAQMGDLYGAIGTPPKLTRTIIYGTEKLSVERLLNILTYFIRCGEVRRSAKRENFNKDLVKSIANHNQNETLKNSANTCLLNNKTVSGIRKISVGSGTVAGFGLTRTQTCKQNLNTMSNNSELGVNSDNDDELPVQDLTLSNMKMNEIPNVFAFRDSRFVQQELRIGNYLMDTGILKSSLLNQTKAVSKGKGKIQLTITTPDNVVMPMEVGCIQSNEDGAVEAIEIEPGKDPDLSQYCKQKANLSKNVFWQIVPSSAVKEGLSWNDLGIIQTQNSSSSDQQCRKKDAKTFEKRISHLSLSDLITQNSMGKSDRMTWGIEPIKENISLEEQIHFDFCQKLIDREHGNDREIESDVVFVLGENEPLVNIKKNPEELVASGDKLYRVIEKNFNVTPNETLCVQHQRTHGRFTNEKKQYSGVKFNFETYPQIATQYMKSKNLVMPNLDFGMGKFTPPEAEIVFGNTIPKLCANEEQTSTSSDAPVNTNPVSCIVCSSIFNSYQTPSNATELEFETDEEHGYAKSNFCEQKSELPVIHSATSVNTLKSESLYMEDAADIAPKCNQSASPTFTKRTTKKMQSQRGSASTVASKCAAVNEAVRLLKLPVPGIKELPQEDEPTGDMKLKAGFIPSLFLNVSDHYIPDMVLQGTFASPKKWEMNLREDLALAAHSASLVSLPAENVAIVADMEQWNVRLISSQPQSFPYAAGQSSPVGMSQLVSSMLETVHAMNSSGISAYECLSFLESKLQEIYLQSETLAAFLLDTDFCPLSTVTAALNLSENDVPLLLSVASIHTPQISKKCGISFR